MSEAYCWQKSYLAALLETDGAKIMERLQVAESEISDRQRELTGDHGGTAEEQQAIADAVFGITCLRKEASAWQSRHASQSESKRGDADS